MDSEHSFKFLPGIGVAPWNAPEPAVGAAMQASAVPASTPPERPAIVTIGKTPASSLLVVESRPAPNKPVTGREILRMAKARVREIDKLLATVPALEKERAAMQRLVDAANAKPARVVRLKSGTND